MDIGKLITAKLVKKLAKVIYEEAILPALKDVVSDTHNTFDDAALLAADGLIREWLAHLDDEAAA